MALRSQLVVWLYILLSSLTFASKHSLNYRDQPLQDIVTWDADSMMINGERLMVLSGEYHPFRLPAPGLWLDIFQKIKATGFNTVSFYVDWALVEGKQGDFSAEGVFALDGFYDAAKQAGIYLLARPGPYINAELSGGGLPGWIHRTRGHIRTNATDYETAAIEYIEKIGPLIARGQITNGGPVIMVQPENEYSTPEYMLSKDYMQHIEDALRDAGVVVPLFSDDGFNYGNFVPGSGLGEVDIYGHNSYPLGFDCSEPGTWTGLPSQYFPTDFLGKHLIQSPSTPYAIPEFEAGTLDHWAGSGFEKCAEMLNNDFERVLYKHNYAFGIKIFNLYMMYGGTNWGNMGHSFGYTSYDYGAPIKEDRTVMREKYSELKLQANSLLVSPQYLVATAHNGSNTSYTSTAKINVTPLTTNTTSFWIVRHADFQSRNTTQYKLQLPTSVGKLTVPELGGDLQLVGRDSKMLVTDYPVGKSEILYSTAEVFTWQTYGDRTVLVLFGGPETLCEVSFKGHSRPTVLEGKLFKTKLTRKRTTVQWKTSSDRVVFIFNDLVVYMMDRNSAYDLWVPHGHGSTKDTESVIVKAGYLVRNATVWGNTLNLVGDNNQTTALEVIGSPKTVNRVTWNVGYERPNLKLPDLAKLQWKALDSLPEIKKSYDDTRWTVAANKYTNNTTNRNLTTPVSLYGSDYGFNTGALIYRGRFKANGKEETLLLQTQGGNAFVSAMWLGSEFLDGWAGEDGEDDFTHNVTIGALHRGKEYILTVVVDQNGFDESGPLGSDTMKTPRGIIDYTLSGHEQDEVTWKISGNLHGEDYEDRVRGPLNEGGFFAERKGYHLPGAPYKRWKHGSPLSGMRGPGVGFYAASFDLDMPDGWDIPLSFVLPGITSTDAYRAQIYVNGWQFGKYASNLGPQTAFPVPEGILDYHGTNYLTLTVFAVEKSGAKLSTFNLEATAMIESGYGRIPLSPQGTWSKRKGSY